MSVLSVAEQGATLRIRGGRLRVEKRGVVLADLPAEQVSEVLLLGGVQPTVGVIRELLSTGGRLHFLSLGGYYLGRLEPTLSHQAQLLRCQVRQTDRPAFCLSLAQQVLRAKLDSAKVLLARFGHRRNNDLVLSAAAFQAEVAVALQQALDLDTVRGLEGIAAQAYFAAFAQLVPMVWGVFPGRRRRPPTDAVNAMLSFGYALLLTRVVSALQQVGLHSALGFLHTSHGARPALALDLMEEYRAAVVDLLVLRIMGRKQLGPQHFEQRDGGVYLNAEGRTRYLKLFAQKLSESTQHRGNPIAFRDLLVAQARSLAAHFRETSTYVPYTLR